jgi:metal-responsive CopG/Arc/MetJ family transcriptional regulator
MLSTALAIQTATQDAVHDESVMGIASMIFRGRNEMSEEEFIKAMFMYSAHLSALTATLVTSVCLTESELDEMMNTINEFDSLGKDITNGNE